MRSWYKLCVYQYTSEVLSELSWSRNKTNSKSLTITGPLPHSQSPESERTDTISLRCASKILPPNVVKIAARKREKLQSNHVNRGCVISADRKGPRNQKPETKQNMPVNFILFKFQCTGDARTQSPPTKNCAPESPTFGEIASFNPAKCNV